MMHQLTQHETNLKLGTTAPYQSTNMIANMIAVGCPHFKKKTFKKLSSNTMPEIFPAGVSGKAGPGNNLPVQTAEVGRIRRISAPGYWYHWPTLFVL